MSTSRIVAQADAVAALLNEHDFSLEFDASRKYVPIVLLKDAEKLNVIVVPRAFSSERLSRAEVEDTYSIDVGIIQRIQVDEAVDALMGLVGEVNDFLSDAEQRIVGGATWISTNNDPIYAPDHMNEMRQFTSVITVAYLMRRGA